MSSSLECNPATLPIEVEPASKEPQLELRNEEVRVQREDWQDPICKLFATEVNIPLNSNDSVKLVDGELRDEEIQSCEQRQIAAAPPISKYVVGLAMASRFEERVAGFLEMGFSTELIQRAIQLHGAQAEDSTLLQFILDWKKDHAQSRNVDDEAVYNDNDGPEEGLNIAALAERSPPLHEPNKMHLFKSGSDWESEESDSGESDSDDDDETPCRDPSPIDRDAEATESFKLALCSRPIPSGEGHRHLLLSQGFQPDLIERAIQELGEGVEADMLIEYILYLTSEQEHGASTSEHASTKGISTVEKLVTEFQFPSDVVERAVKVCHTPLWNAEEDQIADVVDFVMAHDGELEEEEIEGNSDDECEEDNCWTFVREQIAFDVAAKRRGKRKIGDLDFNAVSERVPIPRIQRIPIGRIKRVPTIRQRKPRVELEVETCVEPLSTGRITRCRVRRPRMRRRLEEKDTPTEKIEKIERNRGERIERHRREKIEKIERHRGEKIEKIERHRGAVGFGLPGEPVQPRYLSEDVKGAPFFYFENVASMPNDEWARIRRHLFDVEPEFVDSLHFSACRRPRGYIHNLPIEGRRKILADPPMTIQELMPQTKIFWPDWDPRTKLNCIKTTKASEFVAKKLQIGDGTELQTAAPSPALQQEILHLCRSWNLVWTGPNTPTPISENEIESDARIRPRPLTELPQHEDKVQGSGQQLLSVHGCIPLLCIETPLP